MADYQLKQTLQAYQSWYSAILQFHFQLIITIRTITTVADLHGPTMIAMN